MADGMHQVGFSQSDSAINIKRIISFRWHINDCQGRGVGELITRTDHESLKSIFWIQRQFDRLKINDFSDSVAGNLLYWLWGGSHGRCCQVAVAVGKLLFF